MTAETRRLTLWDGRITGLASTGGKADLPLIVMLPGGGGNAAQFDTPNRSFLATAVANGFSAIALNRPAQGDSAPLDLNCNSDSGVFAANVQRLLSAIFSSTPRSRSLRGPPEENRCFGERIYEITAHFARSVCVGRSRKVTTSRRECRFADRGYL
jgi:pimeloyl-ACP methyl ester carboxylesterase